ncbi:DUF1192 domain-containing protein [Blastomonas sp.]|uniref:DUF1192 domain-containing protein n=1 Tax=Blastomonas sp. TaxID=1909299 RepID=UPI003593E7B0
MDGDESLARLRADAAQKLGTEDIDAYSVDELGARIALCRAEIGRCEARKAFATQHRASAEALFSKG